MPGMKKKPRFTTASVGFAVLAAQVSAGSKEVQLLPAGDFRAADGSGRPDDIEGGKPWRIDAAVAALVIARAGAQVNQFIVDYEHQTLKAAENGLPAPAAARWKTMEWREGIGLFATDVQWTQRASQLITAGEYLYISAVFFYDRKSGDVLAMRMAALTNTPALDGMQPLAALTAQMGADWIDPCGGPAAEPPENPDEETLMNELLKKLLAALVLSETTTAEDALTAVTALKAKADTNCQALAALKAQGPAAGADLTKYVPIETYQAALVQLAALTAQGDSADMLISAAEKEGKVLPSEKGWLTEMSKTHGVAVLKSHLAVRPVIAALMGLQSSAALTQQIAGAGGAGAGAGAQVTAEGLAVCKQLGLSTAEWLTAGTKS